MATRRRHRHLPKYLSLRWNTYTVSLDIPKDVRPKLGGKPRFVKSLKTDSLSVAERRKWPLIEQWKEIIRKARAGEGTLVDTMERWIVEDKETEGYGLEDFITDKRDEEGDPSYFHAHKVASGEWVPLADKVPAWEKDALPHLVPKVFDSQASDIKRMLGKFTYLHEVDTKTAKDFLNEFDVSTTTKRRILAAWRSFFESFGEKNRLRDVSFGKESRRARKPKSDMRQPLQDAHIAALLVAAVVDQQLRDLILLGAYTGARIEEICSLKLDDVTGDRFNITESKTPAGVRGIPIHSKLQQTVERLISTSTDGYLMSDLAPDKYGLRSSGIGKRFGRLKTKLGMDHRYVFHSLRKSFITKLEDAAVPENFTARIVGHDIGSGHISYGVYSGGVSFDVLKDAVEKVQYDGISTP